MPGLIPERSSLGISIAWAIAIVGAAEGAASDFRALFDAFRDARDDWRQLPPDEVEVRQRAWIETFEAALDGSDPQAPGAAAAMTELASLYRGVGEGPSALTWYDLALETGRLSPSTRAGVAKDAINTALHHTPAPEQFLWYLEHYRDAVIEGASSAPEPFRSSMQEDAARLDLTAARFLGMYLQTQASYAEIRAGTVPENWEQVSEIYEVIIGSLERFTEGVEVGDGLSPLVDDRTYHEALHDLAHRHGELARMYEGLNMKGRARPHHREAVASIERLLALAPGQIRNDAATSLLIREMEYLHSPSGYVDRLENFLKNEAAPGFDELALARGAAVRFSNDERSMVAASDLFELIRETEKAWFPDEYRRHNSYQMAMIRGAYVAMKLGNFAQARELLALMEDVEVLDAYRAMHHRYRDHLGRLEATGHAEPTSSVETPVDPTGASAPEPGSAVTTASAPAPDRGSGPAQAAVSRGLRAGPDELDQPAAPESGTRRSGLAANGAAWAGGLALIAGAGGLVFLLVRSRPSG